MPDHAFFAVASPGLEEITAAELRSLGIAATAEPGGASWTGPLRDAGIANLHSRTASRILVRIAEFNARTFHELERRGRKVPWAAYLGADRPAMLRVTCRKSRLFHQGAVAERLLDAITEVAGERPNESVSSDDTDAGAAQLFVVRVFRDRVTISADASGARLHQRGYRQALARAPLRENIAAAMLIASGWDGRTPLMDPLCGSGTIAIEAALLSRDIAPGLASAERDPREFAFTHWAGHDARVWRALVDDARSAVVTTCPAPILASDRAGGAIRAAKANAARAGVDRDIAMVVQPLSAVTTTSRTGFIVTNPPYGVRVGAGGEAARLDRELHRTVRERFPGWTLVRLAPGRSRGADRRRGTGETRQTSAGDSRVRAARTAGAARASVLFTTRTGAIPVTCIIETPPGEPAHRRENSS